MKEPIVNVSFYPTQMAMLTSEGNEILIGGSKGGGKSYILRWAAFLWALYVEGLEIYFFRKKYNDLRSNHIWGPEGILTMAEPFIKAGKASFNHTDNRLDVNHGKGKDAHIFFRHVQHDKDVENYRGIEAHAVIFDELTHFPSHVYNFLRMHVRLGGHKIDYDKVRKNLPFIYDGYFPRICSGTNPGGQGHAWVKKEFIDSAPPNEVWVTPPEKGGMKRVFIPSKITDNVRLLENDPGYIDRIKGMGGELVKAFLDGDWNIMSGNALSDIWDDDIHILPRLVIPQNAEIYRGLDWGTFHPSVVLYMLRSSGETLKTIDGKEIMLPKGSLVVFHEIYNWDGDDENVGNRKSASEVGRQIAEFESHVPWIDNIQPGPADRMIFQQRGGSYFTIDDQLIEGYNSYMREYARKKTSFNWQYDTKMLFEEADQSTGSRVTGLSLVRDFLLASVQFWNEHEERRGLYFTENVRHCITTLPELPRSETNPEDTETNNVPDHAYDVVRYFCLAQSDTFERLELRGT